MRFFDRNVRAEGLGTQVVEVMTICIHAEEKDISSQNSRSGKFYPLLLMAGASGDTLPRRTVHCRTRQLLLFRLHINFRRWHYDGVKSGLNGVAVVCHPPWITLSRLRQRTIFYTRSTHYRGEESIPVGGGYIRPPPRIQYSFHKSIVQQMERRNTAP